MSYFGSRLFRRDWLIIRRPGTGGVRNGAFMGWYKLVRLVRTVRGHLRYQVTPIFRSLADADISRRGAAVCGGSSVPIPKTRDWLAACDTHDYSPASRRHTSAFLPSMACVRTRNSTKMLHAREDATCSQRRDPGETLIVPGPGRVDGQWGTGRHLVPVIRV